MAESTHILVVDDEESMREGMRRVLQKRDYQVDVAENGEAAIRMLDQKVYDIALVDLKMPGIDGFQVTEYINDHYPNRTVVVIVSAVATVEAAMEVTRSGAFDFLVKPFTPQDLLQMVERAERQRRLMHERATCLCELNSERNLSRQILNSLQEGLVVLNVNRKPVLLNPRAEYFMGISYREDLAFEDLPLSDELKRGVEELLGAAAGKLDTRMYRCRVREGMYDVRLTPYVRDGEIGGLLILMDDITEDWKAEQDKNRFIYMVAHELKSPLAAILNYINVIQSGMFDNQVEKIHEMLERSKVRGEALLDLIRDLLDLNQRAAGRVEKSIEELDLREVLKSQMEFMQLQAERRGVRLHLEAENGAEYRIRADRGDMDRIFMNLISNGIKYNREQGDLEVRLDREDSALIVTVRDTGIGMSPQEMSNLFQEFYRVKNSRTVGIAGTGLGLATVKRVLAEYNGRITIDSAPEQGTTVRVTLPQAS